MWHPCRHFQQPCLGRSKPSCCICSLPPIRLCTPYLGGGRYVWHFSLVLRVTPMAQCTDLMGVYGENTIRISGGNSLGTQEKWGTNTKLLHLILHVSSDNTSLPLTTLTGLDKTGLWCGLPGHQTSHHLFFLQEYIKTCDLLNAVNNEEGFIVPYCWGSSNPNAETWHVWAHRINSALYSGWWLYIRASALNW
jgi:hypothetical protein